MSVYTTPPAWQPDAVPTPRGWKHPTRDELLVSINLDMSLFEKEKVEDVTPDVSVVVETEKEDFTKPAVPAKKSKKKHD